MKTFKQFIAETVRDTPRAVKLAHYLMKRAKKKDLIYLKNREDVDGPVVQRLKRNTKPHPKNYDTIVSRLMHAEPNAPVKTFRVDELIPIQKSVYGDGVIDKMTDKKLGDHGPIRVATFKRKHYVVDGHTRYTAARLKGQEEIEGYHHQISAKNK